MTLGNSKTSAPRFDGKSGELNSVDKGTFHAVIRCLNDCAGIFKHDLQNITTWQLELKSEGDSLNEIR